MVLSDVGGVMMVWRWGRAKYPDDSGLNSTCQPFINSHSWVWNKKNPKHRKCGNNGKLMFIN